MNTQLQDRLSLPYAELEELNLKAKEQRKNRVRVGQDSGRASQVPHRREADQGRHACCSATSKAVCTCSITTRSSSSRAGTT